MTLLLAFLGMMYEYILAHYISSIVGGAYVILFVTFCLFASALGLGSVIYNFISDRFKNLKSLGYIQVLITLVVVCVPLYFRGLNFLFLEQEWSYFWILGGASVPVLLLGLISGFELPLMFRLASVNISRLLVWDYVGMFLGVILFPAIFVLGLHVQTVCYILAFLSSAMALICFIFDTKAQKSENKVFPLHTSSFNQMQVSQTEPSGSHFYLGLFFVFIMSFCSFAYQGLLGKVVISIIGDSFASRSYAIGFFILGMALGAWRVERKERQSQEALKTVLKVETALCGLAALLPVLLYFIAGSWFLAFGLSSVSENQLVFYGSLFLSLFPMLVGFFSGMELPLVFQWLGLNNEQRESYYLIAANYVASIFSGVIVGFILPNFIGYSFSFLLVIMVNLLVVFGVLFRFPNLKSQSYKVLVVILVFCALNVKLVYPTRQFFIETFYAKMHLQSFSLDSLNTTLKAIKLAGEVFRIESFFQDIDMVDAQQNSIEGREKIFYLYLNKQPQFNSDTITNYHQSMLWASASFLEHKPQSILILGGGDGLLAAEILKYYPDTPVTLVELDAAMVSVARQNPKINIMNEDALSSEQVTVLLQDAYQYVRRTDKRYDLVFIDFPYPVSIDISRLYSHEFYTGVRRVLTEEGVLILDAPIITRYYGLNESQLDPNSIKILNTIKASGFKNPFVFGPYDPFVAVSKNNRELKFKDVIRDQVPNSVFVNLHSLEHNLTDLTFDSKGVNYVLKPTIWGME